MRYIVDVSEERANTIGRLINEGRYQSVGQFIATAIENQIYIEQDEKIPTKATSPENLHDLTENSPLKPARSVQTDTLAIIKKSHDVTGYPETVTSVNLKLPDYERSPVTISMPRFAQLVTSLSSRNENKTWLWGQINKILPVKVGLRTLYLLIDSGESIELDQFRERAADVAFAVGEVIREHEQKQGKKRDERISAGLPGGDEPFKSKNRYKTHFAGYVRKDGKLDGAMCLLKFVNVHKDQRGRLLIGLTDPGAEFARLDNPPLDGRDLDRSLSQGEVEFYLEHIQKNVPGEFEATRWLLKTIFDGVTVREAINRKLKEEMAGTWHASDAVINTQRAGLTSRASELGLIKSLKNDVGSSVQYELTSEGKALLS